MDDVLRELEQACADADTDTAMLTLAAESWFVGEPARAERGQVALAVGGGETIVVRSDDVAAAERLDTLFLIRVRPGAPVLVRLERTATVGGSCGSDLEPSGQKLSGRIGGVKWPHGNLGGVFDWPNTCFIWIQPKLVCEYVKLKDKVLRVCWNEWTVVETCPDPIVPA